MLAFIFTVCLLGSITGECGAYAETLEQEKSRAVLISGVSDASQTYAVIRYHGIEYRTDQIGTRSNQILWNELSADDRMKLIRTYGWYLKRRQDAFGSVSDDMADFYNDQTGWTELVEALKDKRMSKDYPRLRDLFGPDSLLNLPVLSTSYPEVMDSETFRKAKRLAAEIQADYELGQSLYTTLTNVKWDQVSVAVKGISGPLIKMIIDNFVTSFVVHGAKPMSELVATVNNFVNDFQKFLDERRQPGKQPPTPGELIERLEELLDNMELWAAQAADAVESKRSELMNLKAEIDAANERIAQERRQAGEDIIAELEEQIAQPPDPLPVQITSQEEEGSYAYWADMNKQANARMTRLLNDARELKEANDQEIGPVAESLSAATAPVDWPEPVNRFFSGIGSAFGSTYFEVNEYESTFNPWTTQDYYAPYINQRTAAAATIREDIAAAQTFIATAPGEIDQYHAVALGLDSYQYWMGSWDYQKNEPIPATWLSSERFLDTGVRDLSQAVAVVATPDAPNNATAADLGVEVQIIEPAAAALKQGEAKRREWMQEAATRYEDLRFNFENSLSLVMATLDQFDALHAEPPFMVWTQLANYVGHVIYKYAVDIDALRDRIQAQPTPAARYDQRLAVIEELRGYVRQELDLERRLAIAQNAHLADAAAMSNFIASLSARYAQPNLDRIEQDFQDVIGKDLLLDQYALYNNLINDDFTYYYLGSPGYEHWVRTPESCRSLALQASIQLISGKTYEYYLLLDVYNRMETDESSYLSMSREELNAFNTYLTEKIGSYPEGAWISQFKSDGVWGVEYPAWSLVLKTNLRLERLNSLYNGLTASDYSAGISGTVRTSSGLPLSGVLMRLSGAKEATTTTDSSGAYSFDYLPGGDFTVSPQQRSGYQPEFEQVSFDGEEVTADFILPENDENGYPMTGQVLGIDGKGMAGVLVQLFKNGEFMLEVLSRVDGRFVITGLQGGTYTVRLSTDEGMPFSPATQERIIPGAAGEVRFVVDDAFGDIDNDNVLTLKDVVSALRIEAGMSTGSAMQIAADVNGDGRLGTAEGIYVLKVLRER